MKTEVVSLMYNEQALIPFFLRHYQFADKITVFLDDATDDESEDYLFADPGVTVHYVNYPDGFNDSIKINIINDYVRVITDSWVICVDADEFIWPSEDPYCRHFDQYHMGKGIRERLNILEKYYPGICYARMYQVYRNKDDADLDPEKPVWKQRRHGDPNTETGINARYNKPCIVPYPGKIDGFAWSHGCHSYVYGSPNGALSYDGIFTGAHWANADPELAVERQMKNRRRQSRWNLKHGLHRHCHKVSEESIRENCERHLNDPLLFDLNGRVLINDSR